MSQKRGRGRPPVFVGALESNIVRLIRQHGLTGAQRVLADEGVQPGVGKPKSVLSISLPTLGKLAERNGVELRRGRPRKAA